MQSSGRTNRVTVGFISYDQKKKEVQLLPGNLVVFLYEMIKSTFSNDRFDETLEFFFEIHPVPGHPDSMWILAVCGSSNAGRVGNEGLGSKFLWAAMAAGMMRADGSGGICMFKLLTTLDGRKPRGIFRFRFSTLKPTGELVLPENEIGPEIDERAIRSSKGRLWVLWPSIPCLQFEAFQGWWTDMDGTHQVQDCEVRHPRHGILRLHPHGDFVGYLVWGDSQSGYALWAILEDPDRCIGRLELVKIVQNRGVQKRKTGRIVWSLPNVLLDRVVSIPDGRWAAVKEETAGEEPRTSLVVGVRQKYRTLSEIAVSLRPLGAIPLSDTEWVLVDYEGLFLLKGMKLKSQTKVRVGHMMLAASVLGAAAKIRIPESCSDNSQLCDVFHRLADEAHYFDVENVFFREDLACICLPRQCSILFLPSFRDFALSFPGGSFPGGILPGGIRPSSIGVGRRAYLVPDRNQRTSDRATIFRFFGPDGEEMSSVVVEGVDARDVKKVFFVGGFFLVLAVVDSGSSATLLQMTFSEDGELVYREDNKILSGWKQGTPFDPKLLKSLEILSYSGIEGILSCSGIEGILSCSGIEGILLRIESANEPRISVTLWIGVLKDGRLFKTFIA